MLFLPLCLSCVQQEAVSILESCQSLLSGLQGSEGKQELERRRYLMQEKQKQIKKSIDQHYKNLNDIAKQMDAFHKLSFGLEGVIKKANQSMNLIGQLEYADDVNRIQRVLQVSSFVGVLEVQDQHRLFSCFMSDRNLLQPMVLL